ncbi:hypothetical protein AB0M36_04295 [Actinoplanes sp. NPDC051346]|uniref:helix-turn-helix domain-containing protein n=1 Tax=Actinoplanes sp. NPDC051346 TaxID=3155048 RepID=UPI003439691F
MITVQRWTGRETRALRVALRLPVRSFAAYLGVGVRTIANWEAGGSSVMPRPEMQAALDTALIRADPGTKDRFANLLDDCDDSMLSKAATASDQTVEQRSRDALDTESGGAELRERLEAASAVDRGSLSLLTTQLNQIREIDRKFGVRTSAPQLGGYLATIRSLRSHTIGNREALADLYADAPTLAGWQCLDMGNLRDAWNHYEAAKEAGREGRSSLTLVHALAEQAYVLVEIGDTRRASELVEYSHSIALGNAPDLLIAWLWAVRGEVKSVAGEDPACRAAFDAAEITLPADCCNPETPFIVLSEVHLARWRGNAWARLGDPTAIESLQNALNGLDESFVRARAGMHADLAGAFLTTKQFSQANAHVQKAEVLATRVGSARQQRRIRQLKADLPMSSCQDV